MTLVVSPDDWDEPIGQVMKMYPSGTFFDFDRPNATMIHLDDIAHHLSLTMRHNGGTASGYSVAEHAINVAAQLFRLTGDPHLALAGLHHDDPEAFTGDLIRPMKRVVPGIKILERAIEPLIVLAFELEIHPSDPRVKQIDDAILPWEMAMIRDSDVRVAPDPERVAHYFTYKHRHLKGMTT